MLTYIYAAVYIQLIYKQYYAIVQFNAVELLHCIAILCRFYGLALEMQAH